MFYIKQEITKVNTTRQTTYNENGDIVSMTGDKIIKIGTETYYYVRSGFSPQNEEGYAGGTLLLEQDFQFKTLFETEEQANTELSFILQDPMFEKGADVTYSVESE